MSHPTQTAGDRKPNFQGIHAHVAKRLLVAWILLSLAVGAAMTYLEIRRVDALAFGLAMSASESFRLHVAEVGEQHADTLKVALAPLWSSCRIEFIFCLKYEPRVLHFKSRTPTRA